MYLRKIANLQKTKVQLRRGKAKIKYVLLQKKTKQVQKDDKSLRKRDVAKIIQRRKNILKKCVSNEGKKNNNVQENINFTHNEETHVKNMKNYDKRQALKIVKEEKRIKEQQRRNCNTLQINTNVKSRKNYMFPGYCPSKILQILKKVRLCAICKQNIKSCRE